MDITFKNNTKSRITISCKRSSDKKVSVHEYSTESFSNVLNKNNKNLKLLLDNFQANPSLKGFIDENLKALTEELSPYSDKLPQWVLACINVYGDNDRHWASHILTYDNNDSSISFHDIDTYIDLLKKVATMAILVRRWGQRCFNCKTWKRCKHHHRCTSKNMRGIRLQFQ